MPVRYSLFSSSTLLSDRFGVEVSDEYRPTYNAAPTRLMPVITNLEPGGFSYFFWGLSPKWSKNKTISAKLFKVETTTVLEKAHYRKALANRRCLVPADGYYEWKIVGKREQIPYRILLKSEAPFSFAGIWEEHQDESDQTVHTYRIITTTSTISEIGSQMPVILDAANEKIWLNEHDTESLSSLLVPPKASDIKYYTISPMINSLQEDNPAIIKPSQAINQFGNYTLFD